MDFVDEFPYEIGTDWNQDLTDPVEIQKMILDNSMDAFGVGIIADFISLFPAFGSYLNGFRDAENTAEVGTVIESLADFIRGLADIFEQLRDAITQNVIPAAGTALRDIYDYMSEQVTGGIANLQTTLNQIRDLFMGLVVTPVNNVVQSVKDWLVDLLGWQEDTDKVKVGIVEGWQGTTIFDADQDVWDTMNAIRSLVNGEGYTRVPFTSTSLWPKPSGCTEIILVGIAAGQNGFPGAMINPDRQTGGNGGLGGGHKTQAVDPSTLSAIHVTVGVNGASTVFRKDGPGGAILMEALNGGSGGMATLFGYTFTNSQAGNGGKGGDGSTTLISLDPRPGVAGSSSAAGIGGAGAPAQQGAGQDGQPGGQPEGGVSMLIPCGGGGGGGGAGGSAIPPPVPIGFNGGTGGAGGFPGGGGGGGGGGGYATVHGQPGPGGAGGAGLGFIYYR